MRINNEQCFQCYGYINEATNDNINQPQYFNNVSETGKDQTSNKINITNDEISKQNGLIEYMRE
jgi:hypothetical protein